MRSAKGGSHNARDKLRLTVTRHTYRGHQLRGGGEGRARVFDHGEVRFVILQLIADKPRYGYEVIKAIEQKIGGGYSPSPGIVYPTLTMLEELGYAEAATRGGKKLYTITSEGKAAVRSNKATIDAILKRIAGTNSTRSDALAPQLVRAMENLNLALRLRLERGPPTDDEIRAIAAALDRTAIEVEQS
jgi:DNA-binding PadR family transcriptional regulator